MKNNQNELIEFLQKHNRRPRPSDPSERSLANYLCNITNPRKNSFNPELASKINNLVVNFGGKPLKCISQIKGDILNEDFLSFLEDNKCKRPSNIGRVQSNIGRVQFEFHIIHGCKTNLVEMEIHYDKYGRIHRDNLPAVYNFYLSGKLRSISYYHKGALFEFYTGFHTRWFDENGKVIHEE